MKHMPFENFESAKGFPVFGGLYRLFNISGNLNYSC